jgi:hypothetical protein
VKIKTATQIYVIITNFENSNNATENKFNAIVKAIITGA